MVEVGLATHSGVSFRLLEYLVGIIGGSYRDITLMPVDRLS